MRFSWADIFVERWFRWKTGLEMEDHTDKPSDNEKWNQLPELHITSKMDSIQSQDYFPYFQKFCKSESNSHKKNIIALKDKMHDSIFQNNFDESILDIDSRNNRIADLLPDQEISMESLLQSIELSNLSFPSADSLLEDINFFEQASQMVDPSLKISDSTPFSFNNNDSVQLFRFGVADSDENNLFNRNCDDLVFRNIIDKCDKQMLYKNDTAIKNSSCSMNDMLELIDNSENANGECKHQNGKESKQLKNGQFNIKKKSKIRMSGPIKKGRRYLPNFKQEVLEYAKNHTFKETASHFNINSNTITEWSRVNKRLPQKQRDTSTMPGTDYRNHKTDKLDIQISKTEIILFNDDISVETDYNESSWKHIKEDLQSVDMKPDERFLKWVESNRLQRQELTRQAVFHFAKYCVKKSYGQRETPDWFISWLKRYNRVFNLHSSNGETEKYIKYPNSFKLEVVLYARLFTKNSAARVFNVPRKRMFDWFNHFNAVKALIESNETDEKDGEIAAKNDSVLNFKRENIRNKIYSDLHLWYQKMFYSGARPTSNDIKDKAREIFLLHGLKEIKFSAGWLHKFCQRMNIKLRHNEDDQLLLWILTQFDNNVSLSHQEITEKSSSLIGKKQFKGSKGWTLRFLKRHSNLLQRCPTHEDQLPQIVQEKLTLFWDNFRDSLVSYKLGPGNIGCMDEIPVNFSYPEETKLSNIPLLRKTGFENCQGVVILSALANGRLLPPAVVFKGVGPKQLLPGQDLDILILYQEKGLVTVDVLETWLNDVWLSCSPNPSALVVDSFEPHRAKSLKQLLARKNSLLHVIPDGCSSKFQPLDVEVTPSFKDNMKNLWKEFSESSHSSSAREVRRYRCPDRDTILIWIQKTCEKVNRNPISIMNGFKTTGLLQ